MTQMNEPYLYRGSAKEAKRRDELPLWRESHKANIACREAIEDAIRRNFDGMNLDPECLTPVLQAHRVGAGSNLAGTQVGRPFPPCE